MAKKWYTYDENCCIAGKTIIKAGTRIFIEATIGDACSYITAE